MEKIKEIEIIIKVVEEMAAGQKDVDRMKMQIQAYQEIKNVIERSGDGTSNR